jgi:hypothetical protein
MIALQNIQEKVNTAKLYYQVLLDKYYENLSKGCNDIPNNLLCIKWLILALTADILANYNTPKTQALYVKLVGILGAYNEAFVVDPNVVIPNTTYQVVAIDSKPPILITSDDFVDNVYTNADLIGLSYAVFDQNLNRFLQNGTQFTYNASGGIIIIDGIYGGEQFMLIF